MADKISQDGKAKKELSLKQAIARKERIEAQIKTLAETLETHARTVDTRRKILVGALVLKAVESNPNQKLWLEGLLDKGLKRQDERALFGMPPLPSPAKAPAPAKAAPAAAASPAPEKAPDKPAPAGPVTYYGFTYSVGGESTAYMPDFQGLGRVTLPTAEKAAQALADKAKAHVAGLSTRPAPRSLDDARRDSNLDLGSLFKGGLPTPEMFTVEL